MPHHTWVRLSIIWHLELWTPLFSITSYFTYSHSLPLRSSPHLLSFSPIDSPPEEPHPLSSPLVIKILFFFYKYIRLALLSHWYFYPKNKKKVWIYEIFRSHVRSLWPKITTKRWILKQEAHKIKVKWPLINEQMPKWQNSSIGRICGWRKNLNSEFSLIRIYSFNPCIQRR